MIYSTPSYYGRHYEFNTTTPEQRVVVLQFNDYGSKSGVATGTWYRNYTMLYDNSMYAARWVAYSLSEWHFVLSSSIGRPGWIDNPALREYSGSYQENTTYDRGHQIANMMRNQCSSNAQQQTFFHANQMPQINKFNQGNWVALENKELTWKSECDTMYVVTGPIFDGNYTTTPDSRGTAIPVATRYFKAMIKCNWQRGELSEVKGIGFLFTHSSSSKNYNEAKCSIVDIESVLGYKLFANLPSKFATAKQNSTPSKFTSSW
jgi:endonuclease G